MDDHKHQQPDPGGPENLWRCLQEMTIAIDRFRAEKDLQVSDKVTDYENEKPGPSSGTGPKNYTITVTARTRR